MKNSEYWAKRARELEEAQNRRNERYIGGELERIYGRAIRETEKDIARWFARFAKNNKVTMAQARKLLKSDELKELKWTVEEYIEYGQKNGVSGEWIKQLENASARYHISRLDALKLQMREHVEELTAAEAKGVKDLIQSHYEDSFYKTAYEVQKFTRVGTTLEKLDRDGIERVLSKPWAPDGIDFSSRIWGTYRPQLVNELHKTLSQAIIMGENPKVIADGFVKYVSDEAARTYKQKKSRAENLVITETAYFRAEGQRKSYKELGVEEFENCATLDSKTSEICRDMDGTHFPVSEMQPGLNCPPFHPRCRTATCPYFNDEFTADEVRAARAADGSYYTVPADITYREWEKTFVKDSGTSLQNGAESGIIKSLEADDFELVASAKGVDDEVSSVIANTVKRYEDSGEAYINEFKFDSIASRNAGTVLLQIEPIAKGILRLNVNTDVVGGQTLNDLNSRIAASSDIVANSLEEAVIHECGHAKLIMGLSVEAIKALYDELKDVHIDGISKTAYSDGAEAIAEIEILLARGEQISEEVKAFYDKYMGR